MHVDGVTDLLAAPPVTRPRASRRTFGLLDRAGVKTLADGLETLGLLAPDVRDLPSSEPSTVR